jgi:hypothetical protein
MTVTKSQPSVNISVSDISCTESKMSRIFWVVYKYLQLLKYSLWIILSCAWTFLSLHLFLCAWHCVRTSADAASFDSMPQNFAQSLSILTRCIYMISRNILIFVWRVITKFQKATISFVMPVCPSVHLSVCLHKTTGLPMDGFSWN